MSVSIAASASAAYLPEKSLSFLPIYTDRSIFSLTLIRWRPRRVYLDIRLDMEEMELQELHVHTHALNDPVNDDWPPGSKFFSCCDNPFSFFLKHVIVRSTDPSSQRRSWDI